MKNGAIKSSTKKLTNPIMMKERWEWLHGQRRFLPRYPSEEVVRYVFTYLAAASPD